MSTAEASRAQIAGASAVGKPLIGLDLGWRNFAFAFKTALAVILALAICYWLELTDPQWTTLTVFLIAQPTVGGSLSKGIWRAVGTILGAITGLVIVKLFSQAPELLVAATSLAIGAAFYIAARLRNFLAYGALLGAYTILLVAYEGSADPLNAWSVAADRSGAMLIGILCSTATSLIILPRYAGDMLRAALKSLHGNLAGYVATALRLSAPPAVFAKLRGSMVSQVVSFDALRSFAVFETPEMRADGRRLRRIVREFLLVLSIARGLFVRIDAFAAEGAKPVEARIRPVLEATASAIERLAADPAVRTDPARLRGDLLSVQRELGKASADLEAMAGSAPFDALANGILILRRVRGLLDQLVMVVATEAAIRSDKPPKRSLHGGAGSLGERREAFLLAFRASLTILLLSIFWMATGWAEGFAALTGGIITLLLSVNQDNQQGAPRAFLIWSTLGVFVAYLATIFVLPNLEGFGALSLVLVLLLFVPGLMAGTPRYAIPGMAFGCFMVAQLTTGNLFAPDELSFVSGAIAIVVGMMVSLVMVSIVPVTSLPARDHVWQGVVGTILPEVARGRMPPRRASEEIVAMLQMLLPRLALDHQRDEDFFRGTLGAASSAMELGRLAALRSDPDMPPEAAERIGGFVDEFASRLEGLAARGTDREAGVAEAEASVDALRAELAGRELAPGPAARALLQAGASLRFLSDRFDIDRAYLERGFDDR